MYSSPVRGIARYHDTLGNALTVGDDSTFKARLRDMPVM